MSEQSFMKAVFHGVISEELIFPYPDYQEYAPEESENLQLIIESVKRFLDDKVDAAAIDKAHEISPEILEEAKGLGLFGLQNLMSDTN